MAELANTAQRVVAGVGTVAEVQSRVIGCYTALAPAVPVTYCYTAGVGQRLVLLNVQVQAWLSDVVGLANVRFWVKRGYGRPENIASVEAWENVVPMWFGEDVHGVVVQNDGCSWSWDMDVKYEGAGQRFGGLLENTSSETGLVLLTFRIAEY